MTFKVWTIDESCLQSIWLRIRHYDCLAYNTQTYSYGNDQGRLLKKTPNFQRDH